MTEKHTHVNTQITGGVQQAFHRAVCEPGLQVPRTLRVGGGKTSSGPTHLSVIDGDDGPAQVSSVFPLLDRHV